MNQRLVWLGLALSLTAVAPACKHRAAPVDGIGPWHIGKTTVADGFVCEPQKDGTTWCSNQPEMTIAEQRATVDLYFSGQEQTSVLEEIILAIGSCNSEAVDKWLTSKLGPAPRTRGKAFTWPGSASTVMALLPASDGECEIHFLRPDADKRMAQIEKDSLGKK